MRSGIIFVGVFLTCGACNPARPEPVVTQATMTVSQADPACRDYTVQAIVGDTPQTVTGHACQQSDGSWRVSEGVTGQRAQFVQVYPPFYPADAYDSWFWGPPIGFSIGAIILVDHGHGHRFHTFRSERGFAFHNHDSGLHGFAHGDLHHRAYWIAS